MITTDIQTDELVTRGKKFYEEKLKASLEPAQNGKFAALEPDSEQYFVA